MTSGAVASQKNSWQQEVASFLQRSLCRPVVDNPFLISNSEEVAIWLLGPGMHEGWACFLDVQYLYSTIPQGHLCCAMREHFENCGLMRSLMGPGSMWEICCAYWYLTFSVTACVLWEEDISTKQSSLHRFLHGSCTNWNLLDVRGRDGWSFLGLAICPSRSFVCECYFLLSFYGARAYQETILWCCKG